MRLIALILLLSFSIQLKLKDSAENSSPYTSVTLKESDRDPFLTRRYLTEIQEIRARIRDLETSQEVDKDTYLKLLGAQNIQIASLSEIAITSSSYLK